jgi:hypothetical protein
MTLHRPARAALATVRMCDAPAEEAPADEEAPKESVLDSLSEGNAEMLETIKGLTLAEAAALCKEVETTFDLGPKDEAEEEVAAE